MIFSVNGIANFSFPFENITPTRDYDVIDYAFLANKGVTLSSNWDIPVKGIKIDRSVFFPGGNVTSNNTNNIIGIGGTTNTGIVLEQEYFPDADAYYSHAIPKSLVFVDDTISLGAQVFLSPIFFPLNL